MAREANGRFKPKVAEKMRPAIKPTKTAGPDWVNVGDHPTVTREDVANLMRLHVEGYHQHLAASGTSSAYTNPVTDYHDLDSSGYDGLGPGATANVARDVFGFALRVLVFGALFVLFFVAGVLIG